MQIQCKYNYMLSLYNEHVIIKCTYIVSTSRVRSWERQEGEGRIADTGKCCSGTDLAWSEGQDEGGYGLENVLNDEANQGLETTPIDLFRFYRYSKRVLLPLHLPFLPPTVPASEWLSW